MSLPCICHRTEIGKEHELNLHIFTDGSIEISPKNGGRIGWMRFEEAELLRAIAEAKQNLGAKR